MTKILLKLAPELMEYDILTKVKYEDFPDDLKDLTSNERPFEKRSNAGYFISDKIFRNDSYQILPYVQFERLGFALANKIAEDIKVDYPNVYESISNNSNQEISTVTYKFFEMYLLTHKDIYEDITTRILKNTQKRRSIEKTTTEKSIIEALEKLNSHVESTTASIDIDSDEFELDELESDDISKEPLLKPYINQKSRSFIERITENEFGKYLFLTFGASFIGTLFGSLFCLGIAMITLPVIMGYMSCVLISDVMFTGRLKRPVSAESALRKALTQNNSKIEHTDMDWVDAFEQYNIEYDRESNDLETVIGVLYLKDIANTVPSFYAKLDIESDDEDAQEKAINDFINANIMEIEKRCNNVLNAAKTRLETQAKVKDAIDQTFQKELKDLQKPKSSEIEL